jgi:hypothetical protein
MLITYRGNTVNLRNVQNFYKYDIYYIKFRGISGNYDIDFRFTSEFSRNENYQTILNTYNGLETEFATLELKDIEVLPNYKVEL